MNGIALYFQGGQTEEEDNILDKEDAVNSLTFIYHDLNICTNSTQYNMIVDTLNNLLLYVEPKRKVRCVPLPSSCLLPKPK